MIIKSFIFFFAFINTAFAVDSIRVDKALVESFTPLTHKYELIIADNCVHCMKQLEIMKECVKVEDVVVILENLSKLSDEQLRRLIRKKKIIYKTYLMDNKLRKIYEFIGVTPVMWMNQKSYVGVVPCSVLSEGNKVLSSSLKNMKEMNF